MTAHDDKLLSSFVNLAQTSLLPEALYNLPSGSSTAPSTAPNSPSARMEVAGSQGPRQPRGVHMISRAKEFTSEVMSTKSISRLPGRLPSMELEDSEHRGIPAADGRFNRDHYRRLLQHLVPAIQQRECEVKLYCNVGMKVATEKSTFRSRLFLGGIHQDAADLVAELRRLPPKDLQQVQELSHRLGCGEFASKLGRQDEAPTQEALLSLAKLAPVLVAFARAYEGVDQEEAWRERAARARDAAPGSGGNRVQCR
eukprot:SRR837773.4766.p1 GENE.SRR837773.4766~~SRR837773.4766.p1  ORF type:complete len:255 (-),score=35.93 SRR837773.4766:35-799(-)